MNWELIACASAVGLACGLAGFYLVLRRTAMMADAVAHSVLPGIVAAYALSGGPNPWAGFLGALAAALASSWLISAIARSRRLKDDAAIGLVFPAMFALGVLAVSVWFRGVHLDADSVLFGEIALAPLDRLSLGGQDLGPRSLWIAILLFGVNGLFLAVFRKQLFASTFDPEGAVAQGARPGLVHGLLMAVVSATAVAAFSAVGAVLSVALLVAPTVAAGLLTRKFGPMLWLTLAGALVCSAGGSLGAIWLDWPVSGLIAVCLGILVAGAALAAPRKGLIVAAVQRRRRSAQFCAEMLTVHLATHAGSRAEQAESAFSHLVDELGWQPGQAQRAVREAIRMGAVTQSQGMLQLTPVGRQLAAEASGRRGPVRS